MTGSEPPTSTELADAVDEVGQQIAIAVQAIQARFALDGCRGCDVWGPSYSIGPPKILEGATRKILESAVIAKAKGCQTA